MQGRHWDYADNIERESTMLPKNLSLQDFEGCFEQSEMGQMHSIGNEKYFEGDTINYS